jgi:hypothetical protein
MPREYDPVPDRHPDTIADLITYLVGVPSVTDSEVNSKLGNPCVLLIYASKIKLPLLVRKGQEMSVHLNCPLIFQKSPLPELAP